MRLSQTDRCPASAHSSHTLDWNGKAAAPLLSHPIACVSRLQMWWTTTTSSPTRAGRSGSSLRKPSSRGGGAGGGAKGSGRGRSWAATPSEASARGAAGTARAVWWWRTAESASTAWTSPSLAGPTPSGSAACKRQLLFQVKANCTLGQGCLLIHTLFCN